MLIPQKIITINHLFLKVTSLAIGFCMWLFISKSYPTTRWVEVPLCFFGTKECQIKSAESVFVQLFGKREALQALDTRQLAAHIDARSLHEGKNALQLTQQHLLLPDFIKLIHYEPTNLVIEVTHNQKQE